MRACIWITAAFAGGALFMACTSKTPVDEGDTATGGHGGHTTTTTHSTSSSSSSSSTSSDTGGAAGVCGTDLSYQNAAKDTCLTTNCCPTFDPCNADATCQTCLTGSGAGCDTNALFQAYTTCLDGSCPTDMCGTGIGFSDQNTGDPIFACNSCGAAHCCTDLTACVGDGSQAALDLCIACLNGDASCTDSVIQGHAQSFNTCISSSCASECG